jgi:isopentenyl phosphate kinase
MLTFVKLGGSLITDKRIENSFREGEASRVAAEINRALAASPELRLLVGHGSGSFGHVAAKKYGTMAGVRTSEQWRGFAEVGTVAAELNYLMAKTLHAAGVPVLRVQPSASAVARDGEIIEMAVKPIQNALDRGLVPLVYGDVGMDEVRGGTILSTEKVFFHLAQQLPVTTILLLGEVDGVYDQNGVTIPHISPGNLAEIEAALGGSSGTDVTGGMETKVRDMVVLAQKVPGLSIRIMNGITPDLLYDTLRGNVKPGTEITA